MPTPKKYDPTVPVECPHCKKEFRVNAMVLYGRLRTPAKAAAARRNGVLGGRPEGSGLLPEFDRLPDGRIRYRREGGSFVRVLKSEVESGKVPPARKTKA